MTRKAKELQLNKKFKTSRSTTFVLLVATILATACGAVDSADVDAARQVGGEGEPCYPSATCDGDLVCLSDICVRLGDDAAVPDAMPMDAPMDALADAAGFDAAPLGVEWTGGVNVTAVGSTLLKTSGGEGWNAGAVSTRALIGDGYFEFVVPDTGTSRLAGLSNGDTDQGFDDIDFALSVSGDELAVVEGGLTRDHWPGAAGAGDSYRVQVASSVVTYWQKSASADDWTLRYTSAVAPTFPLLVDCTLYHVVPNSTVTDAVLQPTSL